MIFSGANIDPEKKEYLRIPEKRNCAETQAAMAAKQIKDLDTNSLVMMFLYRKPETGRIFTGEKLLPCVDCYKKYLSKLIANKGFLILSLDDPHDYKFLSAIVDPSKKTMELKTSEAIKFFYRIFDSLEMTFLNIESGLGLRVCSPILKNL